MNKRQKLRSYANIQTVAIAQETQKKADALYGPLTLGDFTVPEFDNLSTNLGAGLSDYPKFSDIPAEFQKHDGRFQKIFSSLFFNGGTLADHGLKLKPGISHPKAMAAIRSYMTSWECKHEHKTATVAWALSEWCVDA